MPFSPADADIDQPGQAYFHGTKGPSGPVLCSCPARSTARRRPTRSRRREESASRRRTTTSTCEQVPPRRGPRAFVWGREPVVLVVEPQGAVDLDLDHSDHMYACRCRAARVLDVDEEAAISAGVSGKSRNGNNRGPDYEVKSLSSSMSNGPVTYTPSYSPFGNLPSRTTRTSTPARTAVARCTASQVVRPCLTRRSPALRATAVETSTNSVVGDSMSARTASRASACNSVSLVCQGCTSARIAVDSTRATSPRSTAASSDFRHSNSGSPLMTPIRTDASMRARSILLGLPTVSLQVLVGGRVTRELGVDTEQVGPAHLGPDQDLDVFRPNVEHPAVAVLPDQAAEFDLLVQGVLQVAAQGRLEAHADDPLCLLYTSPS